MRHEGMRIALPSSVDVAVIGAGPVGCVAALSFAARGARVSLLEASPGAARRLAGEWIHPPGVEVLSRLGVRLPDVEQNCSAGRGFVVFPHDRSGPILLPYADGGRGMSCQHELLVASLREVARARSEITYIPRARVTGVEGRRVGIHYAGTGQTASLLAGQIVGASGRSGAARRWLAQTGDCATVSYTAGVLLEDVELPFEEFGHVVLGGPGPVLIYRLDEHRLRVCLDVPLHRCRARDASAYLWGSYGAVMPTQLRLAFRTALERRPILWAANRVRPRTQYGQDSLAYVGDAVGHFHPLTAAGMALGFADAETLAHSTSLKAYRKERSSRTRAPELLAAALYAVFTHDNETTMALRQAVYQLWRQSPRECARTMHFLSGEDSNLAHFSHTFVLVLSIALRHTLGQAAATRRWGPAGRVLGGAAAWLHWLGRGALHTPSLPPPSRSLAHTHVEPPPLQDRNVA